MGYVIAVVAGLVVGAVLSYAFRGKEHAAVVAVGSDIKGVVSGVEKKL